MYVRVCKASRLVKAQHICDTWEKRDWGWGRGGSARGLVKHEPFFSLKEKPCLNQSLFAPAVICLRTSAGANKHISLCSALEEQNRPATDLNGMVCTELHRGRD